MVSMNDRMDIDDVRSLISKAMQAAGMNPALIHAFMKTGLLVGEDSPHTTAERKEWFDAVNEWYDANKGGE